MSSDEQAIIDLAIAYTWALDTKQLDELRSVFAATPRPTSTGWSAMAWTPSSPAFGPLGRLDATQHLVGNHQVVVDGDTATHRCHLQSQHVKRGTEGGDNFLIGGTYDDRLVRTPDGWRITHRTMTAVWTDGNPAVIGRDPPSLLSGHTRRRPGSEREGGQMTDTIDPRTRLEEFFRRRSDDPDSVKVVDHQPITGGYSRQMARVWVEDGGQRRGYIVRQDPPPGQAIIDTDRATEWEVLSTLHNSGRIPMPAPLWYDPTGEELGSPAIVIEMVDAEALVSVCRKVDPSELPGFAPRLADVAGALAAFPSPKPRRASRCRRRGTTTSTPGSSTGSMPRRRTSTAIRSCG